MKSECEYISSLFEVTSSSNSLVSLSRDSLEGLSASAQAIDTELTELLSGTPAEYAELIYNTCISVSSTSPTAPLRFEVVSNALGALNSMQVTVVGLMDKILQIEGVGNVYRTVEGTNRRLKEVVKLLEDIHCTALLGAEELVGTHRRGELLFQYN